MAFRTRICVMFNKGQCNRPNCSFAHGDAELRRYNNNSSSSFNGRRDYRGTDLREKIGRLRSPPRRNSFDRDARDPLPSHGYISPRLVKKSDQDHRKRQRFDGESDYSSLRLSDGTERQSRERKPPSSEFQGVHDDQLKQARFEIDRLEDHKEQLQISLEASAKEAESLNSKIEALEKQLSMEKEECRRISSKLRKFVKANNRHIRIQEELKRSQARLQRLGEQLGLDARTAANEDDIGIDMLSDEENLGNLLVSPQNDKASPRKDQYKASPSKKRTRVDMVEADEKSKLEERRSTGNMRSERHSRGNPRLAQTQNADRVKAGDKGISNTRHLANVDMVEADKSKPGINPRLAQTQNTDKLKAGDNGISNTRHLANVDMVEADKSKPGINPRLAQTQNTDKVKAGDNGISNTRHLANVDTVEADDKSKPEEWGSAGNMRHERHSRGKPHLSQTENTDKLKEGGNGINNSRHQVNVDKPVRRKNNFTSTASGDKLKDIKSTRMVASMVDEVAELSEQIEAKEISSTRHGEGSTHDNANLPISLPPPPPLPVGGVEHLQYIGKDEAVDIGNDDDLIDDDVDDDVNDGEMLDVDIV